MQKAKSIILSSIKKLENKIYIKEREIERIKSEIEELKEDADKLN